MRACQVSIAKRQVQGDFRTFKRGMDTDFRALLRRVQAEARKSKTAAVTLASPVRPLLVLVVWEPGVVCCR